MLIANVTYLRTGDLGRVYPDGLIQILGRNDSQVKISGHRVNLLEIEQQVVSQSGVVDCRVFQKTNTNGISYTIAYVCGENIDIEKIRTNLYSELPHFMVPTYFMIIDRFPTLTTGKIDKSQLPGARNDTTKNN